MSDNRKKIKINCQDCHEEYNILTESIEQVSYCIYCGSFVDIDTEDDYIEEEYDDYDE
jgi:ribosomal protein S27E